LALLLVHFSHWKIGITCSLNACHPVGSHEAYFEVTDICDLRRAQRSAPTSRQHVVGYGGEADLRAFSERLFSKLKFFEVSVTHRTDPRCGSALPSGCGLSDPPCYSLAGHHTMVTTQH
jgi:hypothetical protein